MITLYTFGRAFGLPDPSPFVTKAEVLLKLANLQYRMDTGGFGKAPKGKLPYLSDGGVIVADSTFIRRHLETRYKIDFDLGLSRHARGVAWAVEKMLEDHVYWGVMRERWLDGANFDRRPRRYFDAAPLPIRLLAMFKVKRDIRRTLHLHGLGRHTPDEITELMRRAIQALADVLADKPFLMGDVPCGADATAFSFAASMLCPHFEGPIRRLAEAHPTLIAYRDRGMARWFPELANG